MKILLISSSPRREGSLTYLLAKEVLRGCASEADITTATIYLSDVRIEFCRSCEVCHKDIDSCSIKDDISAILKKMLESDAIILASPNYINQVTASMKALFDRSNHFIHCKRLLGKYIAGVVSSGGGQDKGILDYILQYSHICGAQYSGGVSARVPISKEKMEEAYLLGKKLAFDVRDKKIYPEQLEDIEKMKAYFKKIIQMRSFDWTGEYQYWQDKGWL